MKPQSIKDSLESAQIELDKVTDQLIAMQPEKRDPTTALQQVAVSLQQLAGFVSSPAENLQIEPLLRKILTSAHSVRQLLDAAGAFYRSRLSAAYAPAASYAPDGEAGSTCYSSMIRMEA